MHHDTFYRGAFICKKVFGVVFNKADGLFLSHLLLYTPVKVVAI